MGTLIDFTDTATVVGLVYSLILFIFLVALSVIAFKKVKLREFKKHLNKINNENSLKNLNENEIGSINNKIMLKWDQLSFCDKINEWCKLLYKLKNIYASAFIHFYDIITANKQLTSPTSKDPRPKLNMLGLALSTLTAFLLYRIISALLIFKYTKSYLRFITQFLDLDILYAIYISYLTKSEDICDLQRWIQKLEAIFESSPQCMLQIVYLVLSGKKASYLVISSLFLSVISVAQRFTNDDRIFFSRDKGYELDFNYDKFEKCQLFFNFEFIQRYVFRICDVFSRITILSLIWIILPFGGWIVFGIIIIEGSIISIWSAKLKEFNKLQFLLATYFVESSSKHKSKERTAQYSFVRRIENLFLLSVCCCYLLFDNKFLTKDKNWIFYTKCLFIISFIFSGLSSALYFFTHHIMIDDLSSTVGTNERDLVKVIQNTDSKTLVEMLYFGYTCNIDVNYNSNPNYINRNENINSQIMLADEINSNEHNYLPNEVDEKQENGEGNYVGDKEHDIVIKINDEVKQDKKQSVINNQENGGENENAEEIYIKEPKQLENDVKSDSDNENEGNNEDNKNEDNNNDSASEGGKANDSQNDSDNNEVAEGEIQNNNNKNDSNIKQDSQIKDNKENDVKNENDEKLDIEEQKQESDVKSDINIENKGIKKNINKNDIKQENDVKNENDEKLDIESDIKSDNENNNNKNYLFKDSEMYDGEKDDSNNNEEDNTIIQNNNSEIKIDLEDENDIKHSELNNNIDNKNYSATNVLELFLVCFRDENISPQQIMLVIKLMTERDILLRIDANANIIKCYVNVCKNRNLNLQVLKTLVEYSYCGYFVNNSNDLKVDIINTYCNNKNKSEIELEELFMLIMQLSTLRVDTWFLNFKINSIHFKYNTNLIELYLINLLEDNIIPDFELLNDCKRYIVDYNSIINNNMLEWYLNKCLSPDNDVNINLSIVSILSEYSDESYFELAHYKLFINKSRQLIIEPNTDTLKKQLLLFGLDPSQLNNEFECSSFIIINRKTVQFVTKGNTLEDDDSQQTITNNIIDNKIVNESNKHTIENITAYIKLELDDCIVHKCCHQLNVNEIIDDFKDESDKKLLTQEDTSPKLLGEADEEDYGMYQSKLNDMFSVENIKDTRLNFDQDTFLEEYGLEECIKSLKNEHINEFEDWKIVNKDILTQLKWDQSLINKFLKIRNKLVNLENIILDNEFDDEKLLFLSELYRNNIYSYKSVLKKHNLLSNNNFKNINNEKEFINILKELPGDENTKLLFKNKMLKYTSIKLEYDDIDISNINTTSDFIQAYKLNNIKTKESKSIYDVFDEKKYDDIENDIIKLNKLNLQKMGFGDDDINTIEQTISSHKHKLIFNNYKQNIDYGDTLKTIKNPYIILGIISIVHIYNPTLFVPKYYI